MRSLGDADWYGFRARAPLTGREPVLGRLRNRLRRRQPGWGWVTVTGPWGSGVTRTLQETADMLAAEGGPPPVWVRPAPEGSLPLEPVRRAIVSLMPGFDFAAGSRHLRSILACPAYEVDALALWLFGGSRQRASAPAAHAVRALLERLVPAGPLLVDDFDELDAASRDLLLASAQHVGPGVIAGITGNPALAPEGTAWSLDPLAESQVELLLRRWVRNTATARRLSADLERRYDGWPGRIVEAVRAMGRAGYLVREKRGVVLHRMPRPWPAGRRAEDAFVTWVRCLGSPASSVLDLVAVQGEPADMELVADAADVKRSVVRALLAEASAARNHAGPAHLFASREERRAFLIEMGEDRRRRAAERLAEAWRRRMAAPKTKMAPSLAAAVVFLRADCREDALAVLRSALAPTLHPDVASAHVRERLAEIAGLLGPCPSEGSAVYTALSDWLLAAGRADMVRELMAVAQDESTPAHGTLRIRAHLDLEAGRSDHARRRLEEALDPAHVEATPACFDAWSLLASLHMQAADAERARSAWRCAGRALLPEDLRRRAVWHTGAAACAAHHGRHRAVAAHLGRAVRMLEALGCVRESGTAWARLGAVHVTLDKPYVALDALSRASYSHHLMGDAHQEARVRFELGRILTRCLAFDRAAEELEAALAVCSSPEMDDILPNLHVALAIAYRGRGDLALERHHAAQAAGLPGAARIRVRAKAMLAEADLRSGAPGALRLLERCEPDLRAAGFLEEADNARAVLFDARLRAGDTEAARELLRVRPSSPLASLGQARLDMVTGLDGDACARLERLTSDLALPVNLRIAAYAHLADALRRQGRLVEARDRAIAAAALMEVTHRSRAEDLRIHRVLYRVFHRVGERGRAAGHRFAARRRLRELMRGAGSAREGLRMARAQWRVDPMPRSQRLSSVA